MEDAMRLSKALILSAFVILIGSSTIAQPAPTTEPAVTQPTSAGNSTSQAKKAASKACSDQANAKGLHGKARKTFRYACKRHGGNAA
jgi:psiF repeat